MTSARSIEADVRLTGIEITDVGGVAVTLERQGSGLRVVALERVLRSNVVDEEHPEGEDDRLLAALQETLSFRGEKCCVVLPPDLVKTRGVTLPFRDARNIDKALPFELEPTLPLPLEGLHIAWEQRPGVTENGGSEVLAFACPEAVLEETRLRVKRSGLELRAITPPLIPSVAVLSRTIQGRFLLIEREGDAFSFAVVDDGATLTIRYFSLSGDDIKAQLTRELWQTLAVLAEREGSFRLPQKIMVSGDMLPVDRLETPLGDISLEPVHMLSATGAVMEEGLKSRWEDGPFDAAMAVAAAGLLGWRHKTIWEQGFAPLEFVMKHRKQAMVTAAMLVLVLCLFGVRTASTLRQVNGAVVAVESAMSRLYLQTFSDVRKAPSANLMARSMEGKLRLLREEAAYAGGGEGRVKVMELLYAISSSIPIDLNVNLRRMVLSRGKLTVTGLADDFSVIDAMKRALEKSPMIKGVTIASSSKESGGDRFQFKVVIALSGGEAS